MEAMIIKIFSGFRKLKKPYNKKKWKAKAQTYYLLLTYYSDNNKLMLE